MLERNTMYLAQVLSRLRQRRNKQTKSKGKQNNQKNKKKPTKEQRRHGRELRLERNTRTEAEEGTLGTICGELFPEDWNQYLGHKVWAQERCGAPEGRADKYVCYFSKCSPF